MHFWGHLPWWHYIYSDFVKYTLNIKSPKSIVHFKSEMQIDISTTLQSGTDILLILYFFSRPYDLIWNKTSPMNSKILRRYELLCDIQSVNSRESSDGARPRWRRRPRSRAKNEMCWLFRYSNSNGSIFSGIKLPLWIQKSYAGVAVWYPKCE